MNIITENKNDCYDILDSRIPIFYAHLIKYDTLTPQSSGWIGTILEQSKRIAKAKKDYPSAFTNYNLQENLEDIMKNTWKIIEKDNKLPKESFIIGSVNYFNTLEKIANTSLVQHYLNDKCKDEKLLTSIYK